MDRVTDFLDLVLGGIRPADVADIAVVSALVYLLIAWFRAARSRFVHAWRVLTAHCREAPRSRPTSISIYRRRRGSMNFVCRPA